MSTVMSNMSMKNKIRLASSKVPTTHEELMREWYRKYQESVDNYLESVKKKRESIINTKSGSGSGTGYEIIPVTVTITEQEEEENKKEKRIETDKK